MMSFLERQFKISERGSSIRTEILSGVVTFVTMSYIVFVNPKIMSETGMDFNALVVATCSSAALATFLMAFLANYPIGLAPGMGLNAFFAFSVVLGMQVDWRVALTAVFVEGAIFIVLTLTRLREMVVNTIPKSLKIGISGGIGLFIAFIGLQSAGIVVKNDATLVSLGHLSGNLPAILALGGLILMAVLITYKVTGALLIGILAVTAASVGLNLVALPESFVSHPPSIAPIFAQFDFSMLNRLDFWVIMFTFFCVDFFDTVGTLVGVCNRSGLLDKDGCLPNARGALLADAIGTTAGAILGTSTVTSYVESASGIAQGGRTGLSAVVTALLFLTAMFFTPVVGMVPAYATAPALIIVGVYMMVSLRDLNFEDWTELVPSILGFIMMPLAYSVSIGIEFAIVSYVLIKILSGRAKDVSWLMAALAVIFVVKEALS